MTGKIFDKYSYFFFFLLPEASSDFQTAMYFKLRSTANLKAIGITPAGFKTIRI